MKIEINQYRLQFTEQSYIIRASKSWNNLPGYIRENKSIMSFKKQMKEWTIMQRPREPDWGPMRTRTDRRMKDCHWIVSLFWYTLVIVMDFFLKCVTHLVILIYLLCSLIYCRVFRLKEQLISWDIWSYDIL